MDKIKQWLDSLGVGEYVPLFAANHIEFDVLRDLSDADLKDIGVASLGHRRKLIRAIASLPRRLEDWQTEVFPSGISPQAVAAQGSASNARSPTAVERRNLTIAFFDLVGFEGLAARLDLEELGEVVHAFHAETAQAVGAYDGFAARCSNDRVMAYFGYPRAHEDDAERAVRAAADVLCAVGRSRCPAPIVLRIAIATGLVVIGEPQEPQDGPARSQRSLTGDAPNLAARLQEIAEPNTIVVSAATRQLLGALFDLRDLGLHTIKGLAEPVRAFAIAGASHSRSFRGSVLHP